MPSRPRVPVLSLPVALQRPLGSLLAAVFVLAGLTGSAMAGWAPISSPTAADLYDVEYLVIVGAEGTILRTTDAGLTWGQRTSPTAQDLVSVHLGGSLFRAGASGGDVPQSFDAGATWIFWGTNPSSARSVVFSRATNVSYVATDEGWLYLTVDAGNNWETRIAGPGPAFRAGETGAQNSPGVVVGDAGTIWVTTNGSDWAPAESGTTENLHACSDVTVGIVVGANGTILKSTDYGATWSPRPSGTTADLNGFANYGTGLFYAVGDGGTILRSSDQGDTWCSLSSGTTADLNAVGFMGGGWEAVAVGDDGTILRTFNLGGDCAAAGAPSPAPAVPLAGSLRAFPNPARSRVALSLAGMARAGDVRIRVVDAAGRVVAAPDGALSPADGAPLSLDVSALPHGAYWVLAEDGRGLLARSRVTVVR